MARNNWFGDLAQSTSKQAGSSGVFSAICVLTLLWLISGPVFHWSDTWQLVINTFTNIVSMLMVFLIQNTQNRNSAALQLKLDELLRAGRNSQNTFINLENLSEDELEVIKRRYALFAERARNESDLVGDPERPASGQ